MPTTEYRVFAADRDTGEAVTLNIAADSPEAAERFQSAPLCRGDDKFEAKARQAVAFQSAPLCRGDSR